MFADQKQFFATIEQLAEEKGIAREVILETIGMAIAAAYKKDYGKRGQIIRAEFDSDTKSFRMYQVKIVVDENMLKPEDDESAELEDGEAAPLASTEKPDAAEPPRRQGGGLAEGATPEGLEAVETDRKIRFNPERHIMVEEARGLEPGIAAGDELKLPLEAKGDFGRIAAQTAKQVIIQKIREAERDTIYREYKDKQGQLVSGTVQRIEGDAVFIDIGRTTGVLTPDERIPGETFHVGMRLRCLLVSLIQGARGLEVRLSRVHPRFVEELFRTEVPEIAQGSVEIKSVAREPGVRAKIAVHSNMDGVDPVGSCVGQRGTRVMTVINELGGEKIDIIEWSPDPAVFIAHALAPAKVADVEVQGAFGRADVLVPEDQLSLAIGRKGQNVRLAAKLTGWRIDISGAQDAAAGGAETKEQGAAESGQTGPEVSGPDGESEEQPETTDGQAEAAAETPAETPAADEVAAVERPDEES
ncbi:MAG: transcription termination factor NusA [bacterium]|nr:transcription termination factor NusA [bacterium]MDZ4296583.1 transcription termination factor NusA [Patescibacteria group bacterium]